MPRSSLPFPVLVLLATAACAAAQSPATGPDDPSLHASCLQWGHIGRGILLAKQQGIAKRPAQSPLEQQILDALYDRDTRNMDLNAAHTLAYQACRADFRRKQQRGG